LGSTSVLSVIDRIPMIVPAHRRAFKQGFSFSASSFEAQLPLWDYVWKHSGSSRAQLHAFFFLERYVTKKELHHKLWETSADWQELVNDWGLCDALAKINTKALETLPARVYERLKLWNKDEDLWKRRQSIVSLLYYSRTKKIFLPFEKIIALIGPLLEDNEYYVQKGVGWSLREVHNVYPVDTMAFLEQNLMRVSAIAFTIAIEKMGSGKKGILKAKRRGK
jgi:3-methyladenine DNA glycosylase AlkD